MERLVLSLLGYLFGFLVSTLLWGKQEGQVGLLPNLRITVGSQLFFLHHWLGFLIFVIILLIAKVKTQIIPDKIFYFTLGLLIGGLNQGLTYKDWFIFIE